MHCDANADRGFGPRIDTACRSFDFTLDFEDIVLTCLPAAVFLLAFFPGLACLRRQICDARPGHRLLLAKLASFTVLICLDVALVSLRATVSAYKTPASVAADVVALFANAGALVLSYATHRHSPRPSTLIALYLSATLLTGLARLRTFWAIAASRAFPVCFTVHFVVTVGALSLESLNRDGSNDTIGKRDSMKELYSSFWDRTVFGWLWSTFFQGYRSILSVNDLPALDRDLQSEATHAELQSALSKYDISARNGNSKACCRCLALSAATAVIPRLCLTACTFLQPFLLNETIALVSQPRPSAAFGNGLIGAWALTLTGVAISGSWYRYQNYRFIARLRGSLTALVYRRSLAIKDSDQGVITAIALVGTDIERIVAGLEMLHEVWASLLDVAVATWLLERKLSLACLAPVILVAAIDLVFIGATMRLAAKANISQTRWIEKVQETLRITSHTLENLRAIKMTGLTDICRQNIGALRQDEVKTSEGYRKVLVAMILLSNTPLILAPTVTFGLYVIIAVYWKVCSLEVSQAFTALALVILLAEPTVIFTQALPSVVECLSCFQRLQEYCSYARDGDNCAGDDYGNPANASATRLRQIAQPERGGIVLPKQVPLDGHDGLTSAEGIQLAKGSITVIQGGHGNLGSATALSAVQVIAQQDYDEKWYATVMTACCLTSDIDRLPQNHDTWIGSKGSDLSGGQKKRLALARALYARRQIVLLDDAFSGLDSQTLSTVVNRVMGEEGLLRKTGSTVLVVSNSDKVLRIAGQVVRIEDGSLSLQATDNASMPLAHSDTGEEIAIAVADAGQQEASAVPKAEKEQAGEHEIRDLRRKTGDLSVYKYYLASSGFMAVVGYTLTVGLWMFFTEFATIWLMWWSDDSSKHGNAHIGMYYGVYAAFGIVGTLCGCGAACAPICALASKGAGDILNRFSQDMELIDMALPIVLGNYVSTAFSCLFKFIIMILFSRYLSAAVPIVGTVIYFLQRFYLQTSRQLRLLGIEAKAPLYAQVSDTASGARTIRAFGWQRACQAEAFTLIDHFQRPEYLLNCVQTWLAFVQDLTMMGVTVVLVAVLVTWHGKFGAGAAGISLVMTIGFSSQLARLIVNWAKMESSIGAVSRVRDFVQETPRELGRPSMSALSGLMWPSEGRVVFDGITVTHTPTGCDVLKQVSLLVEPGQHVAICGRTGSGKTSLIAALLQVACVKAGRILINGVDLASLSRAELDRCVSVVAQDPFIIPGTIRANFDPSGTLPDTDIREMAENVRLWPLIEGHGGLDALLDSSSWSSGHKKLLCFARARLKKTRIVILDEVMSGLDEDSAAAVREVIVKQLKEATVVAITHRLDELKAYDKVAILQEGVLIDVLDTADLPNDAGAVARLIGGQRP